MTKVESRINEIMAEYNAGLEEVSGQWLRRKYREFKLRQELAKTPMTDAKMLNFLLRAIVTAGGPDRKFGQADEVYLLEITNWLLRQPMHQYEIRSTSLGTCGCKKD